MSFVPLRLTLKPSKKLNKKHNSRLNKQHKAQTLFSKQQQQVKPEANKTNIKKTTPKDERNTDQDPKIVIVSKGIGKEPGKERR